MRKMFVMCLLASAFLMSGCSNDRGKAGLKPQETTKTPAASQPSAQPSAQAPKKAAPLASLLWQEFRPPDHSFKVEFPGHPKMVKDHGETNWSVELADGSCYTVVTSPIKPSQSPKMISRLPVEVTSALGTGAQLEASKTLLIAGYPAVDYTVKVEDEAGLVRVRSQAFLSPERSLLVQILTTSAKQNESEKFFASFKWDCSPTI